MEYHLILLHHLHQILNLIQLHFIDHFQTLYLLMNFIFSILLVMKELTVILVD